LVPHSIRRACAGNTLTFTDANFDADVLRFDVMKKYYGNSGSLGEATTILRAGTIAKVSVFGTATTSDATRYWYRVEGEGLVQFYVLVRVDSSSGKNAVECIAHRPDMALCVGANYPGPPVSAN